MTIKSRVPKVKQTKAWPLIRKHGKATLIQVDTDHSRYQVSIPEKPNKVNVTLTNGRKLAAYEYKLVCQKWLHNQPLVECKGNSNGTICYHCLAALEYRVESAGRTLVKPEDGELASAIKLLNLGGQLVKLTNQAGSSKWGVVR